MVQTLEEKKHQALGITQDAYSLGLKYFDKHQFSLSADEFVKVVRPFLSKPAMKNPYVDVQDFKVQILDAMHHLGLIYFKDAESHYADSYSKAAAIFQYCHSFAQKYEIDTGIDYLRKSYMAEAKFLNHLGLHDFKDKKEADAYHASKVKEYAKYKAELGNIREAVGQESKDVFVDNEISTITTSVSILSGVSRDFFVSDGGKSLVQILIKNCQELLGVEPCRFSIVGLGSLAGGKMTLWSDLEFVILTENDDPKVREYFKNLTKLLHIKVINFGETSLRSVGIEHLNNFKTGEAQDEWFWDEIITSGFSFDGPHWHACKLPLGRQGGYRIKKKVKDEETGTEREEVEVKPDFELILTPKQMAELQLGNSSSGVPWFESDKHLLQGLWHVLLIYGNQGLLDDYRVIMKEMHTQHRELFQKRALQILAEDVDKFKLKLGMEEEGKLMDVKKSIYRTSDRIIDALTYYFGIVAEQGEAGIDSWTIIDRMAHRGDISTEGSKHLKEALSIAVGLRLATYSHNGGQIEGISTYVPSVEHLTEEKRKELIEETFHLKDTTQLHHFYYVMMRVQKVARSLCAGSPELQVGTEIALQNDPLINTSYYTRGLVHARFLEYGEAIKCLERAREEAPSNLKLLDALCVLCNKVGMIADSLKYANGLLSLSRDGACAKASEDFNVAIAHKRLGSVYQSNGEYEASIEHFQLALRIFEELNSNIEVAQTYGNMGLVYQCKGEYDRSIEVFNIALGIFMSAYSENPDRESIAGIHYNLGLSYLKKGEYQEAIAHFNRSKDISEIIFADNPNHPHIALVYDGLGSVYSWLGKYDQAIEHYDMALEIKFKVYNANHSHPQVAQGYANLGNQYHHKGEFERALEYYEWAKKAFEEAHSNNPNHPDIAAMHLNLGHICKVKGELDGSIVHIKKAIRICERVYSENPNHPTIAKCYCSLGESYSEKREYDNALSCFDRVLKIQLRDGDQSHPDIAITYATLGKQYREKEEYDKAIECFTKTLEIFKKAYAGNPNHPDIAAILHDLGAAYAQKEEYNGAIEYMREALEICRMAYSSNPNHYKIGALHHDIGKAHYSKGDFKTALDHAKNSLSIVSLHFDEKYKVFASILCKVNTAQLGMRALLENDITRARNYFAQVDPSLRLVEFRSQQFMDFFLDQRNYAFGSKSTEAYLNCHNVLTKFFPEYSCAQHHHLAVFYVLKREYDFANEAFNIALTHPNVESITHVEYAQFLMMHREVCSGEEGLSFMTHTELQNAVKVHLHAAARNTSMERVQPLGYSQTEHKMLCPILQSLISERGCPIEVDPRALAYYLLIRYPEYLENLQEIVLLLPQFQALCRLSHEATSLRLFSDLNDSIFGSLMHMAYYKANIEEIKSLHSHGENINAQNNKGKTPLHCLLERQDIALEIKLQIIQEFLPYYDLSLTDDEGKSVIDIASEHCPEALSYLPLDPEPSAQGNALEQQKVDSEIPEASGAVDSALDSSAQILGEALMHK